MSRTAKFSDKDVELVRKRSREYKKTAKHA